MKLKKRKPSGREKDEESIKLLEQLRERLYLDDVSAARRAAFVLSWKQEDGLDILKEALFGNSPKITKTAAAYGLRSMRGRMKKRALNILEQGLKHHKRDTRDICNRALALTHKKMQKKSPKSQRFEIREISPKSTPRDKVRTKIGQRQKRQRQRF